MELNLVFMVFHNLLRLVLAQLLALAIRERHALVIPRPIPALRHMRWLEHVQWCHAPLLDLLQTFGALGSDRCGFFRGFGFGKRKFFFSGFNEVFWGNELYEGSAVFRKRVQLE